MKMSVGANPLGLEGEADVLNVCGAIARICGDGPLVVGSDRSDG